MGTKYKNLLATVVARIEITCVLQKKIYIPAPSSILLAGKYEKYMNQAQKKLLTSIQLKNFFC